MEVQSPLKTCQGAPRGGACRDVFRELKNPYYIGDQVALTQTTGWVDAWTSQPSVYAVTARRTEDVVATVNFARENEIDHSVRQIERDRNVGVRGTSPARHEPRSSRGFFPLSRRTVSALPQPQSQ